MIYGKTWQYVLNGLAQTLNAQDILLAAIGLKKIYLLFASFIDFVNSLFSNPSYDANVSSFVDKFVANFFRQSGNNVNISH